VPKTTRVSHAQAQILRARAQRCRNLADALGDFDLALILYALSAEYEDKATSAKELGPGAPYETMRLDLHGAPERCETIS